MPGTRSQEPLPLLDALRVSALEALRRGAYREAERALEEGLALARRLPHPHGAARLLSARGRLHLRRGDPEQARVPGEGGFHLPGTVRPARMAQAERDLAALEVHLVAPRIAALARTETP